MEATCYKLDTLYKYINTTYSSHGVDAVDVVVGPAGGQLVGVLLLLWVNTETFGYYSCCFINATMQNDEVNICNPACSTATHNCLFGSSAEILLSPTLSFVCAFVRASCMTTAECKNEGFRYLPRIMSPNGYGYVI